MRNRKRKREETKGAPASGRVSKMMERASRRIGLRARLLAGLVVIAAALVLSVGLIALRAVEHQLRIEQRASAATLADGAARVASTLLELGDQGLASDEVRRRLGDSLSRLSGSEGFVEAAVVTGTGEPVVVGDSRGLPPPGKDSLLATTTLSQTIEIRRQERSEDHPRGEGVDLVLYRHLGAPGKRAALRLTYSPGRAVASLMRRAEISVWVLAFADGVLLLLIAAVFLTRAVTSPLRDLKEGAQRVAGGELGHEVEVRGKGEVEELARAFNVMSRRIQENESTLRAQIRTLEEQREKLERQQRELDESRVHLIRAEKLASVGRLAAGVAHEVGNPLTALVGYVEMLRSEDLTREETDEFLEHMETELRRMDETIRSLLDYSRPDREALSPVDLEQAIWRAASLVKPQKKMRDVDIRIRASDALPPVAGSENRLSQVLVNLFLNAADAMSGKGEIRVEAERMSGEQDSVVMTVSDTGPGVDREIRDKVFDPFFTTKQVGSGTGLGLAICHSILETMGGTIEVAAGRPGRGATFRLVLRVWREGRNDEAEPTPAP
jgi:signal transduction histidine kinase